MAGRKEAMKKIALALKVPYTSYYQARQAARGLKIQTLAEYVRVYSRDKKLTIHPYRTYASKGWLDWYDFLGKQRPHYYKAYQQAAQAARRLGFTSSAEYKRQHRRDLQLPSHPDQYYEKKGWRSWNDFLGKKKPR